jgi:hypothetical protein
MADHIRGTVSVAGANQIKRELLKQHPELGIQLVPLPPRRLNLIGARLHD